jgi:hypothetical protein
VVAQAKTIVRMLSIAWNNLSEIWQDISRAVNGNITQWGYQVCNRRAVWSHIGIFLIAMANITSGEALCEVVQWVRAWHILINDSSTVRGSPATFFPFLDKFTYCCIATFWVRQYSGIFSSQGMYCGRANNATLILSILKCCKSLSYQVLSSWISIWQYRGKESISHPRWSTLLAKLLWNVPVRVDKLQLLS